MADTKRSQNKCKKCGYTWYPRGKNISLKCPSCGSTEVGFAGAGIGVGVIALILIAAVIFSGNKKEPVIEASPPLPTVTEVPTPMEHQTMQLEPASDQAAAPTNIADVSGNTEQVEDKVQTPALTSECAADSESKPSECSSAECAGSATDSVKCESKRAPKNELY